LKYAFDSPLNKEGKLKVFMHTYGDFVLRVNAETRLPRSFNQFCGLIETFGAKRVSRREGKRFLEVREQSLDALLKKSRRTISF